MTKHLPIAVFSLFLVAANAACTKSNDEMHNEITDAGHHYGLSASTEVIVTSEAGDKLAEKSNVEFRDGKASGAVIVVDPEIAKQTIVGIGSSFTESSAFVLSHLDVETRRKVMADIFSENGANFSLARTVVGATDFAVIGKYSYAPVADDAALESFSIAVDSDGFRKTDYPGVQDESFDILPMIREALAIKAAQGDQEFRIVASAWTAPPWNWEGVETLKKPVRSCPPRMSCRSALLTVMPADSVLLPPTGSA